MEELKSLADLLDLQAVDLEIDRLLERRQGLPELTAYRAAHDENRRYAGLITEEKAELEELRLAIDKAEGELRLIEDKKTVEERRMYAGGIGSRDLEHLMDEVRMLGRKIDELEDDILARIDEREEHEVALSGLQDEQARFAAEENRLEEVIASEWKKIDAELARKEGRKRDIIPLISPDLLELYEEIRPHREGVAVGRLAEGVCGGCHLKLSAAEQLEVLRDYPPRCLHCRRILVPQ